MVEVLRKKKIMRCLILIFTVVGLMSLSSCEPSYQIPKGIESTSFIHLEEAGFELEGEVFFPIMINYVADFRMIDDSCVLGVHSLYEKPEVYEYYSLDSIKLQRSEHLKLIKEMGFNTIRLCLDRVWGKGDTIGYPAGGDLLLLNHDSDKLLKAMGDFARDADEQGLKIMMLIPPPVNSEIVSEFTVAMLKHFYASPCIFSYDFNNEPLYDSEHSELGKAEVLEIVSEWKNWMETYAPYQLLTIGYSEPIEVFSWDPALLPVDFLSFHTYNPLRVPNEIYWYSNYSGKPWIIGETALRVDDVEFPYEWQGDYMEAAFERTVACGGIGFGWWGFQEVPLVDYAEESTGLMTADGIIFTSDSLLPITAKFKPAVARIKALDFENTSGSSERKVNYYNMLGYSNYVLTGKLVDSDDHPIEGGCIRGWNEFYTIGQNTFSDENGDFTLYSNDRVYHLMIGAPKKETRQFHEKIVYGPINPEVPKEADLPNRDLEYQNIDYREYLQFDSFSQKPLFFEFEAASFENASYTHSLGTIVLRDYDDI